MSKATVGAKWSCWAPKGRSICLSRPPRLSRAFRAWTASAIAILLPGAALAASEDVDVLVMIINFADASAPASLRYLNGGTLKTVPLNVQKAESVFFTGASSTADRYDEMSQGEVQITGDVTEVSLALSLGAATINEWRAAADVAAVAQGYVLGDYDRFGSVKLVGTGEQMGDLAAFDPDDFIEGIFSE